MIQRIIAGICGIIFAIKGILLGATILGGICYINAILLLIYIEICSQTTGKVKNG